jgi:predicted nucleic acid-binding protein
MTRYLLDTNMVGHFIDHRRGVDERARDARARGTVIGTSMSVVAELFYGVEFSASRGINRPRLIRASAGFGAGLSTAKPPRIMESDGEC